MIHHGLSLAEYKAFLHDLYHIVWHFCPVMAAAAARCSDRFREVRFDLYDRIEEEKGHDTWVLEDIEAIGGDVASARAHPPSAPVQAMIAFNYFGAERVHPCSVLGMLYMLEVVSSVYGGRVSDSIARTLGRHGKTNEAVAVLGEAFPHAGGDATRGMFAQVYAALKRAK